MKTRVCAVAVIENGGKILMGNKAKDIGPYPNTWRLPGGGVKENETAEEAIRREVKEETCLEATKIEKVGYLEDEEPNKHGEMTHYKFHVFRVETTGNENVTTEFPELRWITKSEFNSIPLARPTIKYFNTLKY